MELYSESLLDVYGNVIVGAQITVLNSQGQNATIFNAQDQVKANPFVTGSTGLIEFKASNGLYTLQIYHSAYNGGQVKTIEVLLYDFREATFAEYGEINIIPVYVDAERFTTPGNRRGDLPEGRKLQIALSGGTVHTAVDSTTYDAGQNLTTVTINSLVLTNPINSVKVHLYQPAPFPTRLPNTLFIGDSITLNPDASGSLHVGSGLVNTADVPFNIHDKLWFDALANELHIAGSFDAITGTVGGWNISADAISKGGIILDSTTEEIKAFTGANYVSLTAAGLVGSDGVLGQTFKLPTDGSPPEFSAGVIKEVEFQMYTSGVFKTSDDPTTGGGFLANNTRLAGYNDVGLKLMEFIFAGANQGDAYVGDYDSGKAGIKYDHSTETLSIRGTLNASDIVLGDLDLTWDGGAVRSGQSEFGVGNGFWLGIDPSDSVPKFSIGSATKYLKWNGTDLELRGNLNASDILSGTLDFAFVNATNISTDRLITTGSFLTQALSGGENTVFIKDTSDFPSSGSGWIIDVANDRDEFSWTGKTSNSLTGCSGVLSHNNNAVVIPKSKGTIIDNITNEIRFYDTVGIELASIGLNTVGSDLFVGLFGHSQVGNTKRGIGGASYSNIGIEGASVTGIGIMGVAGYGLSQASVSNNTGVGGLSNTGAGVRGFSTSGKGGSFQCTNGVGVEVFSNTGVPLKIWASDNLPADRSAGSICYYNGALCFANGTHWFNATSGAQLT